MAQGEQRRLRELGFPKQLLLVNREPIIHRMQRLVTELGDIGPEAIDIIGRVDMTRATWGARSCLITLPDPGFCVLDGIAQTTFRWKSDRILILLGDVVFSKAALQAILADKRPVFFAGTSDISASQGEIFAFSFVQKQRGWVEDLLATCPCRVNGAGRRIVYPHRRGGHLRRLLFWAQKSRGLRPPPKQQWCDDLYLPIDDWTNDIDKPADLARLPEWTRYAKAEEEC
jgi:hypothetical protein